MAQGGPAVTIALSGGLPVTQVTSGPGTPFTVLLANGFPITLVDANGAPFLLYDETGATYTTNVAPTLAQNPVVTNDLTPDFDVSLTAPIVGDTITLRWSTSSSFTIVAGTSSNVVDAGEKAAQLVNFTVSPALTDRAAWYFQARHNSSAWSNTVAVVVETAAPTLSGATDTKTGSTTGTGTISTNEGQGTLYWVLTAVVTTPTAAQIRAGQDNLGASALKSGNQAVTTTGTQTVPFTALTNNTAYYAHFTQDDPSSNHSNAISGDGFTTDADVTAPILSSPVDTSVSDTTGSGSVMTDEGNGTLYWVLSSSASAPSAAQVKAGQMHTGASAAKSGSQSVSGTGSQSVSGGFTALTASTTYYAHYMHEDAATNQSNVSSGDGFTTAADTTAPTLTNPVDTKTGATTATLTVDTNEANGTLYAVATISTTAPTAAQVKAGQDNSGSAATYAGNQAISSTGTKSFSATGFTAATAYKAFFMHEDASANQSAVSSGDGFTTDSAYSAQGVLFDGTNDWMTKASGLTGAANGKQGIFSCWFKMKGNDAGFNAFLEQSTGLGAGINIYRYNDNTVRLIGKNGSVVTILDMATVGTFVNGMGWKHILAAWDLGTGVGQIYISDTSDRNASPTLTNDTLLYTNTATQNIGSRNSGGGGFKMFAEIADYYLNTATTLDLSNSANRRKFITAGLKPVDLGSDGSTPTGSAPIIFFSGATASWNTNKGSGGGFTLTGTLTDASDSPSA